MPCGGGVLALLAFARRTAQPRAFREGQSRKARERALQL